MSDPKEVKKEIEGHIAEVRALIPTKYLELLPADEALGGVPAWREFEHRVWAIGEKIRQLLQRAPKLRRDAALQEQLIDVACDRRAHRGRQSFVLLMGYRSFANHAERLVGHLDDKCVRGQVINSLYKMRAPGYSDAVSTFLDEPVTWIRNEARRYVEWDARSTITEIKKSAEK